MPQHILLFAWSQSLVDCKVCLIDCTELGTPWVQLSEGSGYERWRDEAGLLWACKDPPATCGSLPDWDCVFPPTRNACIASCTWAASRCVAWELHSFPKCWSAALSVMQSGTQIVSTHSEVFGWDMCACCDVKPTWIQADPGTSIWKLLGCDGGYDYNVSAHVKYHVCTDIESIFTHRGCASRAWSTMYQANITAVLSANPFAGLVGRHMCLPIFNMHMVVLSTLVLWHKVMLDISNCMDCAFCV